MLEFDDFVALIKQLRAPGGCPWDQKQTCQSLTPNILEEAYELVDAIQTENAAHIEEELGDLLLQIVLIANILEESAQLDLKSVINTVHAKMVRRHPHVFGDTNVSGVEDVLKNWDQIKRDEKTDSIFKGIPRALPALKQAQKISKIAARTGFDWEPGNEIGPLRKVHEEVDEMIVEIEREPRDMIKLKGEIGDALFSLVNVARRMGIDPEEALTMTNQKFVKRFEQMEELAHNQNKEFSSLSPEEMDVLWETVKRYES